MTKDRKKCADLVHQKYQDTLKDYEDAYNYFNEDEICFKQSIRNSKSLRYGENPHQKGVFFGELEDMFHQLHGKELSYNNLLDVDAAVNLISEFKETTFAVLKHNNACGIASRDSLLELALIHI